MPVYVHMKGPTHMSHILICCACTANSASTSQKKHCTLPPFRNVEKISSKSTVMPEMISRWLSPPDGRMDATEHGVNKHRSKRKNILGWGHQSPIMTPHPPGIRLEGWPSGLAKTAHARAYGALASHHGWVSTLMPAPYSMRPCRP